MALEVRVVVDDPDFRLLQGHVLDCLRELEDESVQCVVTSPPYFGLRSYSTEPQVWGGEPGCEHEWAELPVRHSQPPGKKDPGAKSTLGVKAGKETLSRAALNDQEGARAFAMESDTCARCGAWRGELGLEPTPRLYVEHMTEVFREVKRVLRKDGVCFLNLATTYASGDRSASPSPRRQRVRAYGTDGTGLRDFRGPDSACLDLCDGCLADFLTQCVHSGHTVRPRALAEPPHAQIDRDSEPQGSEPGASRAELDDALASTTLESWRLLRGACSRCDSRASALEAMRSASRESRGSVGSSAYSDGRVLIEPTSAARNPDREPSDSAWEHYSSTLKPKDLIPIPHMVAMALQADGWWLRSEICWTKADAMPESVQDRPTRAHEMVFMLTKSPRYFYDSFAVSEPTAGADGSGTRRNLRTVWEITTESFSGAHFAVMPKKLVALALRAGTSEYGACVDCGAPFTRILEARSLNRNELPPDHPEYRPARYDSGKAGDPQSPGAGQRFSQVDMLGWVPTCGCYSSDQVGLPVGSDTEPGYSCHHCGKPFQVAKRGESVAERKARQPERWRESDGVAPRSDGGLLQQGVRVSSVSAEPVTVGWEPSCDCEPERRPCVVMDPFLGSGTTAVVARNMGLHCVGIELSEEYAAMISERTTQQSLLA